MQKSTIKALDFYVYALFSPLTGLPFYIGKGRGRRWVDHERLGRRHYNPLIRAFLEAHHGCEIPKVKIRENLSEAEAFEIEIAFIKALGFRKAGGALLNLTEGGSGASGAVGPNRGKTFSPEHREKIRRSLIGRKHTEEAKARISAAVRAARRIKPISDETKARMSDAASRRAPPNRETREKLRATATAFASTPSGRAAKRAAAFARWSRRVNRVDVD